MGRWLCSLLVTALLIGCTTPSQQALPPVPPADLSPAMRDLFLAERRWDMRRPSRYEFGVEIRCFCVGLVTPPPRFVVLDGAPSALDRQPGEPSRLYQSFDTIDELFQRIRAAIKSGEHKIAVVYDADLGYPRVADLDPLERTVDDELYFRVVDFTVR